MASVLIVDDDPVVLKLLGGVVESAGHEVAVAAEGQEALRLAGARRFDLAVLDYQLPGATGLQLLKELRVAHPALHGIISSGVISPALGEQIAAADAVSLEKPYRMAALLELIRRLTAAPR